MSLRVGSCTYGVLRAAVAAAVAAVLLAGCGGSTKHTPSTTTRTVKLATTPRAAPRPSVRRFLIGRSVQGRPINAFELGQPGGRPILIMGSIEGDEPAGIRVARALLHRQPPPGSTMWVVPDLNPDGITADTRQNAHLVDLNRNFPWHWQPLGSRGYWEYSGPHALSEPESRAARRLILRVRPLITIWLHQPFDLVDLSGGDPRLERRFAQLVGLHTTRLPRYPGSAINWGNATISGGTAFDVELPPGSLSTAQVKRYVHAVLVLANPHTPL